VRKVKGEEREIERDGREEERKRGYGRKTLGKGRRGDLMRWQGKYAGQKRRRRRKKAERGRYLEGGNRQEERQNEKEGRGRK
jgi:hypothetical protein